MALRVLHGGDLGAAVQQDVAVSLFVFLEHFPLSALLAVAAALLLSGGLVALQAAAISTGLPFAVVILVMCYSVYRGLARYIAVTPRATERPVEPGGLRPARRARERRNPEDGRG